MDTEPKGWPRWRIKGEITSRGMSMKQLAIRNDRNPQNFSHVWTHPNFIDEKIIADFLGQKPETLWPDRYPKESHYNYDSKIHGPAQSQKRKGEADRVEA